jgi:hypothetical protein
MFWKCQARDGGKDYPIVPLQQVLPGDMNQYGATMRALGLTREQGIALGIKCHEVMGENNPTPYSRDLAQKQFEREHAACLPPAAVAAQPNGAILYKMENGCTDRLELGEVRFMIGVMGVGIGDCHYSRDAVPAYMMSTLVSGMGLPLPVEMVEGDQFAQALGCGLPLRKLTAGGAAWFRSNPDAVSRISKQLQW